MRASVKVIILLSIGFLFIEMENRINGFVPKSGLLSIMSMSATLLKT